MIFKHFPIICAALFLPLAVRGAEGTERLSLDGPWRIIFDKENQGRTANLHLDKAFMEHPARREIRTPACWEEIEKDYEGVAYYRRSFQVPANWAGRTVRLRFNAVNFMAEVWVNDQAVGYHEGGFTPFEFRVDGVLKPGRENTLIVRVAGPILLQNKRIEGVGPMETPQWRGAIAGGVWQPVSLIATGDAYVKDVFIEPKIADSTAVFHVKIEHCGLKRRAASVRIAVRSADRPEAIVVQRRQTMELHPGTNRLAWTLKIPHPLLWSPDHPHLYLADVIVAGGAEVSDHWSSHFGMRQFTIRDKKFYLNGEPVYLKAAFFEGLYPVKLAYPDSQAMARREIRLAKEAGFNMIRPWRKPPPPMWLDLADEMGVMTVGSLAIECMDFPVETARLPGWVENEVRQTILRDRNRPCVVQWELFNELKRPVLKQLLHPMAMLARQLDPTRLILDESGGWAQGANLYPPYEYEPVKFNDIHHYPGPYINQEVYDALLWVGRKSHEEMRAMGFTSRLPGRNVKTGIMSYISELGYGSLPDLVDDNRRFAQQGNPIVPPTLYHRRLADEHRRALEESGFDSIYPDLEQFCLDQQRRHGEANKRMIEAARCNPAVSGYCIHALVAGDWIIGAGLLDMWRNPKTYAYEATKEASQPRILSIRAFPRNVYAERGARIEITGVNELDAVRGALDVQLTAPDGTVARRWKTAIEMAPGVKRLFSQSLDARGLSGGYAIRAKVTGSDGSAIAENAYNIDVFPPEQLAPPKSRIAVLDPSHSLTPFLARSGAAFVDFDADADRSSPVFVSRTVARNPEERRRFAELVRFVERGGTAVFLQGVGPVKGHRFASAAPEVASPLLPVHFRPAMAIGTWNGIPQLVKKHPIFDGLPADCMMGAAYENVWSPVALCGVGGEPIVVAIGFDWFPDGDRLKRHYYGPGDTWWGAVMTIIPKGRGRMILSQLRLLDNLAKDPVADKILFNLIRYASRRASEAPKDQAPRDAPSTNPSRGE